MSSHNQLISHSRKNIDGIMMKSLTTSRNDANGLPKHHGAQHHYLMNFDRAMISSSGDFDAIQKYMNRFEITYYWGRHHYRRAREEQRKGISVHHASNSDEK